MRFGDLLDPAVHHSISDHEPGIQKLEVTNLHKSENGSSKKLPLPLHPLIGNVENLNMVLCTFCKVYDEM